MTAHERLRLAALRRRADAVMLDGGMRGHFESLAARVEAWHERGPINPFFTDPEGGLAWLAAIVEAAEEQAAAAHSSGRSSGT